MVRPAPITLSSPEDLDEAGLVQFLQSHELCLIEFYGSWCLYHLLTKRKHALLAEKNENLMQAAAFDVVGSERLAEQLGIEFIPSIVLFHKSEKAIEWIGDTDLEVMVEEISEYLSSEVVE